MKWFRESKFLVILAVVCVVVGVAVVISGANVVVVSGDSMEPEYHDGDYLITVKPTEETLGANHPVCWVQLPDGSNVIKRLVGYPGQYVELIEGDTYVDGELIMQRTTDSWDNIAFVLEDGQYLFLGDNRKDSFDGRFWSPYYLELSNIRGVVSGSGLW